MTGSDNYSLFFDFVRENVPNRFLSVRRDTEVYRQLVRRMERFNQTFHLSDLVRFRIIYADERFGPAIGLPFGTPAENLDPGLTHQSMHPDDRPRHASALSKVMTLGYTTAYGQGRNHFFIRNFRMRDSSGEYHHQLYQSFIFRVPGNPPSAYGLMVITNVDHLIADKPGIYQYLGEEDIYFRYPGKELLDLRIDLTGSELDILELISKGLTTKEIAKTRFSSPLTVNTHRRNIMKKTGYPTIHALIRVLQDRAIL